MIFTFTVWIGLGKSRQCFYSLIHKWGIKKVLKRKSTYVHEGQNCFSTTKTIPSFLTVGNHSYHRGHMMERPPENTSEEYTYAACTVF